MLIFRPKVLIFVRVQINANLKADTTEQFLGRKKRMHLTTFAYCIDEIAFALQVPTDYGIQSLAREINR